MTSEHIRAGKKYDAALIWTEDVTKDSFKVCLREMQNFDGKHEDIYVVGTRLIYFKKRNINKMGALLCSFTFKHNSNKQTWM